MNIPTIKKEYRVLKSDNGNFKVGEDYECVRIDYEDEEIMLKNKNSSYWCFSFDDVAELTPLSFNGVRIAIGDTINGGYKVYGYRWFDEKYVLDAIINNDYCYYEADEITSHIPLGISPKETIELMGKKYVKEDIEKALKDVKEVK